MSKSNQWRLGDNKFIRLFGGKRKITFQKQTNSDRHHGSRGITIDVTSFLRMDDVSLHPNYCIELADNIFLKNNGRRIQLTKYCCSLDEKRSNGSFFNFTEAEWQYFWNRIYVEITASFKSKTILSIHSF